MPRKVDSEDGASLKNGDIDAMSYEMHHIMQIYKIFAHHLVELQYNNVYTIKQYSHLQINRTVYMLIYH